MPLKFYDEFWRSVQSWKQKKHFCQNTNILVVFHFLRGGRHLLPHFSQPFFHKIIMFLCLLERKFPVLFKTHLTFFSSGLQKAKKEQIRKNLHFYLGHPVVALKGLRKTVEAYIIKWIISGEPPVCLKSQQDTK